MEPTQTRQRGRPRTLTDEQRRENAASRYRQYYKDNTEIVKTSKKEPIQCDCGRFVAKGNYAVHVRNKCHQISMELIQTKRLLEQLLESRNNGA